MSKIIIFSDTHLTHRFDRAKFKALFSIISSASQIIINGDFWDSYQTTFSQFIDSPWSQLFPLLKSRHTVYLYGNHDPRSLITDQVSLFSDKQADSYSVSFSNSSFHICHGHQFSPGFSQLESSKFFSFLKHIYPLFVSFENLLSQVSPYRVGQFFFYRHFDNLALLKYLKTNQISDQIFVCGHTHLSCFSPKNRYINTGDITSHRLTYLECSLSGFSLIKKTY